MCLSYVLIRRRARRRGRCVIVPCLLGDVLRDVRGVY